MWAKYPGTKLIGNGAHVRKENEKFTVVCSRSPQNLERAERLFLLIKPIVLWRSRCRRRRRFLSSLMSERNELHF